MKLKVKEIFEISPDKGLHECPIFWVSVLTPFTVALLLSIPLMIDYLLCFSVSCYSFFLNSFKLPISIASISIILGVMVGRFHGSAQRAMANQLALTTNRHKSYYDHRDAFTNWVETRFEKDKTQFIYISLDNSLAFYKKVYASNDTTDVSVNYCSKSLEGLFKQLWEDVDFELGYMMEQYRKHYQSELSPESALELLERALYSINLVLRDWGLVINPPLSWRKTEPADKYPFEAILYEISAITMKASEFSVRGPISERKLEAFSEDLYSNIWDENISSIVIRAKMFQKQAEPTQRP